MTLLLSRIRKEVEEAVRGIKTKRNTRRNKTSAAEVEQTNEERKTASKYRNQFRGIARSWWDKLPGASEISPKSYCCTDADYNTVVNLLSDRIHKFIFFGLNSLSFPMIENEPPIQLMTRNGLLSSSSKYYFVIIIIIIITYVLLLLLLEIEEDILQCHCTQFYNKLKKKNLVTTTEDDEDEALDASGSSKRRKIINEEDPERTDDDPRQMQYYISEQ